MTQPASASRRCPHCGTPNSVEAASCAACKHSLPLRDSEQPTGVIAPTHAPGPTAGVPDDDDLTGFLTSPPATDVDEREAPTEYSSPSAGRAPRSSRDGPLEVGQKFGRYLIIKLLGLGGMGAVYRAWDEELGVGVALKIVRPEIAADPEAARELEKRFKRELLLARQVTHPNVVRIHDLGEIDGIKYITMPYVDGLELSTLLKAHEKGLPVEQVVSVARGVVAGLAAAHRAGVVHRDLKPANIMVEAGTGNALIMDFGIARSAGVRDTSARTGAAVSKDALAAGLTVAGAIVGTLEYMAPEQFRGEEVDHRADVYAFGLILYDLLTGRRPKSGVRTAFEEAARRTKKPLPALAEVRPDVPAPLERIVTRCTQPDPAARYATTEELAADIDRLDDHGQLKPLPKKLSRTFLALSSLAILVAVVGTWLLARSRAPAQAPEPMSVLVANFDDRTGEASEGAGVAAGALETAMGTALEGASFVNLYSRHTAQQLADKISPGKPLDVSMARLISAREGIKVIVAGKLEREGTGYAVEVQAVDPANGKVLGTARAAAPSRDRLLAAVNAAAARLRGSLGDRTPESARVQAAETVTTSSVEALGVYVRAQELAADRRDKEALEAFQEALRLDPSFGRAYAAMGVLYFNAKDMPEAQASFDKALKLVDRMSDREKYRTLGSYYLGVALNYEKAVETYEALVKRYPADEVAHANLSLAYLYTGDVTRAIQQVREVLKLNPRSASDRYNLAIQSVYAGDFPGALVEGSRVIKEQPAYEQPYLPIALSKLYGGDLEGARRTYENVEALSPFGASLGRLGRADLLLYQGKHKEALAILQEGVRADEKAGNTAFLGPQYVALAETQLALGQKEAAVASARKATTFSEHEGIRFPAALVLVAARKDADADRIAVAMENTLQSHMMAYAQLVRAAIAARDGRLGQAVEQLRDSLKRRDTWMGRFLLGKLYADNQRYTEALGELDACFKRYGEAGDVFFYDFPTARYLPPLFYYLGRTQQALGSADFKASYERFLAARGEADPKDPLAADARKRLGD
jgi:serine/threonine protein kinase/tetratricopeptide (TPR) repeat protein